MKHKRITLLAVAMTAVLSLSAAPVAKAAELEGKTISFKSAGAVNIAYTYTDMSKTMYAKSAVNVRSLPSTSGTRLGSLSKNQEVAVTGQCNETGWYRISYNGGEGFVSNKYLIDAPGAVNAAQTDTNTTTSTGDPIVDAAIAKYGSHIMIADDGTIYSSETFQQLGTVDSTDSVSDVFDGFDRAAAELVWAKVNEERVAAGLNALTWDENIYNFACQRAQQIVTNYSHEGRGNYGENIQTGVRRTGYEVHLGWYCSPGHHANYMNSQYGSGACAVYHYNNTTYAVENFAMASSSHMNDNDSQVDLSYIKWSPVDTGTKTYDETTYWTASNGITVCITSNGVNTVTTVNIPEGRTQEEAITAMNEYRATQ